MSEGRRYPFVYTNSTIYLAFLCILGVIWFALTGSFELLLLRLAPNAPKYIVPIVFLVGLLGGGFLIRKRFSKLYILKGEGIVHDDYFEIQLMKKHVSIRFEDLKVLTYHDRKRNRGLIISAKGNSVFVEEALHGELDQATLHVFYEALDTVRNNLKKHGHAQAPEDEDESADG